SNTSRSAACVWCARDPVRRTLRALSVRGPIRQLRCLAGWKAFFDAPSKERTDSDCDTRRAELASTATAMTMDAGDRIGTYEIVAAIGAGGMGEVYRARDTRLKRDVALKILPESFATDADRLARFQREAEVLASLSHPNIAGIYGIEESN